MGRLDRRTVLVAEDEPLVGLDIADALRKEGAKVVSAHNVVDARTLAGSAELSVTVLDVNLVGEDCSLICQQLADRSIPFLFYTGYSTIPVVDKWPNAPVLQKPSAPEDIVAGLAALLD